MEVPILRQGSAIGALTMEPEGLYTVFTAQCEAVSARLRLAVFGGREGAYLGLMLPGRDGRLHLRRKLSRLERSRLPEPILYAAEQRQQSTKPEGWKRYPDGTLRMERGGHRYVAIPLSRVAAPGVKPELLRSIGGRPYLVFCL